LKRIAIISEDLSLPLDEGFKKASACVAEAISRLVEDVTVFTQDSERSAVEAEELPRNKLLLGRSFARRLRSARPDVVLYIPQAAATLMSIERARLLKIQSGGAPIVVLSLQRRTYDFPAKPFLRVVAPALVLALSSRSAAIAREAGLNAARVPLGVDTDLFHPPSPGEKEDLRSKYAVGEDKVILHIGHIAPGRNLELFSRVLAGGSKILIVSSTSTIEHPDVRSMLEHPSVQIIDRFVENIEELYRLADGYVFPTFSPRDAIEIPLSVLEAMATNLPVVTTDFGGLPDLFTERCGLFMCTSQDQLIRRTEDMLAARDVNTRSMVAPLTWEHAARTILNAIEGRLG
jgi:glycosyltransferase involved in cell wall biosynthesis